MERLPPSTTVPIEISMPSPSTASAISLDHAATATAFSTSTLCDGAIVDINTNTDLSIRAMVFVPEPTTLGLAMIGAADSIGFTVRRKRMPACGCTLVESIEMRRMLNVGWVAQAVLDGATFYKWFDHLLVTMRLRFVLHLLEHQI